MFKKLTTALTASALAALSLVSIAGAYTGDSFDVAGAGHADKVAPAGYENFTIANGDPNEEGQPGQVKVQPAVFVGNPSVMPNIGAGDDNDKPSQAKGDYTNFTIANGDRMHRVFRSEQADRLVAPAAEDAFALARGSFRDRLESGSHLVFYRID